MLVIGLLIAFKIGLLFILAWNSRFVMDEFVQLGWPKYLGHGLFVAVWHPKAVGYVLFYKLAHLIGGDAVSILLVGRMQTAVLACATLAIVYACARALGRDRLRALAIVLVLLGFSNFMERSFRTIAEPLAVFFAAASLLVVLRGDPDKRRDALSAGVLTGLAFLATQKSLYFNLALGLALVGDALLARRYRQALERGAWLVFGWAAAIAVYCFVFGGTAPLPVLKNLLLGPLEVATHGADAYGNLRQYVVQTLARNSLLYAFCFAGMALELARIASMEGRKRIALIFTLVIAAFVFAHNQPWPYVFIMALPFMALWSLVLFDRLEERSIYRPVAAAALGVFIVASFVRNVEYLRYGNSAQLGLVARAEALVGPNDIYFDGVGMLPDRKEPSTLWLDRMAVLTTLREGRNSEAYRMFAQHPPKLILWSYRMDAIAPVVAPLIRDSYVRVAPNLRIAGAVVRRGEAVSFNVPIAGRYALYDGAGRPLGGAPVTLARGPRTVRLRGGPAVALLLPQGPYSGKFRRGGDDPSLFAGVYD
jgi:hypothetical protein